MAGIQQVYQLMLEGKTAPEILRELKIKPSRLKQIIGSKWIWKMDLIGRDLIPETCKLVALETAMNIPKRLRELATQEGEPGRKACADLMENLYENFPPAARLLPRSASWD